MFGIETKLQLCKVKLVLNKTLESIEFFITFPEVIFHSQPNVTRTIRQQHLHFLSLVGVIYAAIQIYSIFGF